MEFPSREEISLLHNHICRALQDPTRILILYAIHEQPRHVSALAEELEIPQPTASRHLSVLRQRMLIKGERHGPAVIYTLADDRIIEILDKMRQMLRDLLTRQSEIIA